MANNRNSRRIGSLAFGYKCAWLAVKEDSPKRVIDLLPVYDAQHAEWSEGIPAAYNGQVFVSPLISNWILVVSRALPDFGSSRSIDALTPWIIDASQRLGTVVQYFMTDRVIEYHAWCWAERGRIKRAFGWLGETGETIVNVGMRTQAEDRLGIQFYDERLPRNEQHERLLLDEEYVMKLAVKWSINPTILEVEYPNVGPGWLGRL